MRRHVDRARHELVPPVRKRSTLGSHRAEERVEQEETTGDLPSAEISRGRAAPGVRAETRSGRSDDFRDLLDGCRSDARFFFRKFEGVGSVKIAKCLFELFEGLCGGRPFGRPCAGWRAGTHTLRILVPVPPTADELAIVA